MAWALKTGSNPYPSFAEPILQNIREAVRYYWTDVVAALYGADAVVLAFQLITIGVTGKEVLYPNLAIIFNDGDTPEDADGQLRANVFDITLAFEVRDLDSEQAALKGLKYARILDALIEGVGAAEMIAGVESHGPVWWQVKRQRAAPMRRMSRTPDASKDADLVESLQAAEAADDKPYVQIMQLSLEVKFKESFYA